ncbi:hypothetical protein [Yersinia aleksiciae]|uniref:hypothetical protein n=1 Tax=Yersinia aleksiciae TaxID=263819 RepID=UPI001427AAA1|nr:hypothetical protein [Yersinia aleksiciae]NIL01215.1 hypothetical protein [Yersinia aleksiciae]WQC69269.1 hypothetical protein N0K21_11130 [Yersinia aleksiciae]
MDKYIEANAELAADLLRHMADNEIDSDYFAVVTDSPNCGREIQSEHKITDTALMVAGVIDQLLAKLEAAEKERDEAIVLNKHLDLSIRKGEVVNTSLRERAEKAEAQAESNALEIRKLGLQWSRAETAEKERDELEMSLSVANDATGIWKGRAEAAEARLLVPDEWNVLGPTYPAHYTPVLVAMNGVAQHITYQIEEGDNGDYWQPVGNEGADGAPITQFQHWKPLPAGFKVEGE